jgi:hydrogenase maturation protease
MSSTLFLGIGNTLLSDEGVGVFVIHYLNQQHPEEPGATYLDGGTLSFTLADAIASHSQLIVIDAARLDRPPGTTELFIDSAMDRYLTGNRGSVHEVGLTDLLDIALLSNTLPQRRALIGIQPEYIDWGEQPSPAVAQAIAPAAQTALTLHRQWRASPLG